jgi:PAS domain S-box-containing protein
VADLIYRDVNEAACAYFGLTRERMIGHRLLESALKDSYVNCAHTGEPVILDAVPSHNTMLDAVRYYDVRATRVRPGLITLTWRDVTERIESAQRVEASEEQFRLLAENVADVVVRLRDDGLITWASNSIATALGAPAERWVGHHVAELYPPGERTVVRERWAQIVESGTYIGRAGVLGADGTPHCIHLHSTPFFDADGRRDGIVASFRVIDDEVAAEVHPREQIEQRDARNLSLARHLQAQTNRYMSQMHSAARYVESILPSDLDGPVAVTARYLPSEELGGDCYDFRWVDDDHLVVYLVDAPATGWSRRCCRCRCTMCFVREHSRPGHCWNPVRC